MNRFGPDDQSERNDVVDSGLGFIVSASFYIILFLIGVIMQFAGS